MMGGALVLMELTARASGKALSGFGEKHAPIQMTMLNSTLYLLQHHGFLLVVAVVVVARTRFGNPRKHKTLDSKRLFCVTATLQGEIAVFEN